MPVNIALEYYLAINTLEAQEMLLKLTVADYPNSSKDHRSKLHKQMYAIGYPADAKKTTSVDQFQEMIRQGKI